MIGLMLLGFIAIYLYVSVKVTKAAIHWAKASNRKPWLWGGLTAFVMYNLVFWDLIPTLVMHKYYCATQAGFWVYKTPEEWKAENPGEMATLKQSLSPNLLGIESPESVKTWLNQRFYNETKRTKFLHSLNRTENKFFDAGNSQLLARSVDFYRGVGNLIVSDGSLEEWRQAFSVSLGNRGCGDENKSITDTYDQYVYQFWKSGENK